MWGGNEVDAKWRVVLVSGMSVQVDGGSATWSGIKLGE